MNFMEIIAAAIIKEGGDQEDPIHSHIWHTVWHGYNIRFVIFNPKNTKNMDVYCYDDISEGYLFTIYASDLLDPNWSSKTLAKQINDRIAEYTIE